MSKYTDKMVMVLILVVVVMAFGMGAMWSKLQGLGQAPQATQAPQAQQAGAKYKSFEEAMKDVAKQAGGREVNRLVSCMNSGEKKETVDKEAAQATELGVSGAPGFFINGRFVGGAFPYEILKEMIDKELSGSGSSDAKKYSEAIQGYVGQGSIVLTPKQVEVGQSSTRGSGSVVMVEFSDFQCPFCGRAFPTVKQILGDYEGKVMLVYKHLPLVSIHSRAQKTAEAAECAKDQGKFWEFHDKLFEMQSDWASL